MTSLALLQAVIALGGVPTLEVIQIPDGNCPSAGEVRAALERSRAPEGDASAPPYRLLVAKTADGEHVELRDVGGQSLLSRELRVAATDCAGTADAIALIVARYFRELTWAPPPEPLAAVTEPAAAAAPPAAEAPSLVRAADTAGGPTSAERRAPRLVLGAGPAFWTRDAGLAVAITARLRLRGPLHVGVAALLPTFRATSALEGAGRAEIDGLPIIPSIAASRSFGRLALIATGSGLVTIEKGQSQSIAAPATAWRTVLAAGIGVGGAWRLTERLRLAADLAGYRAVLGRSFTVEGVQGAVLEPPPWQAVAMLALEWIVRP